MILYFLSLATLVVSGLIGAFVLRSFGWKGIVLGASMPLLDLMPNVMALWHGALVGHGNGTLLLTLVNACCVMLGIAFAVVLQRALRLPKAEQLLVALQDELRATRFQAERLENQRQEIDSMCTSMTQRVSAVREAVLQKNAEIAMQAVSDAAAALPDGNQCCDHPVVDALLAFKLTQCIEAGIAFDLHVQLQRDCPIQSADLVTIFANLLDNAISAAKGTGDRAFISLTAMRVQDCLLIEICNSFDKRTVRPNILSSAPVPEHGWGLVIVGDVVRKIDGMLETASNDDTFTVSVMLPLFSQ